MISPGSPQPAVGLEQPKSELLQPWHRRRWTPGFALCTLAPGRHRGAEHLNLKLISWAWFYDLFKRLFLLRSHFLDKCFLARGKRCVIVWRQNSLNSDHTSTFLVPYQSFTKFSLEFCPSMHIKYGKEKSLWTFKCFPFQLHNYLNEQGYQYVGTLGGKLWNLDLNFYFFPFCRFRWYFCHPGNVEWIVLLWQKKDAEVMAKSIFLSQRIWK